MARQNGPKTLMEFQTRFPDEEACWVYLRKARWPRGFVCPACGHRRSYPIRTRRLEQCRACRRQTSVTAGTVLHGSRVPLRVWFWAFFFLGRHKQGISALQFQQDTGLGSYQTAWSLLHKVRSALTEQDPFRLGGDVEVDETYVGAREKGLHGGRQVGRKAIVVAAVERRGQRAGSLQLAVVKNVSADELGPFVERSVDPATATIYSDAWRSYAHLPRRGFQHRPETQGRPERRAMDLLPWAHTVFSNLKSWLTGTYHGVSKKHLPRYLLEFVYRFNRRWKQLDLFDFVLTASAQAAPMPYRRLTAEPVG